MLNRAYISSIWIFVGISQVLFKFIFDRGIGPMLYPKIGDVAITGHRKFNDTEKNIYNSKIHTLYYRECIVIFIQTHGIKTTPEITTQCNLYRGGIDAE